MSSSRLEAADDDGVGMAADNAPAAALQLAQEQENARVTLFRCLRTLLRMMEVRGYTVLTEDIDQYQNRRRAEEVESSREIILYAEVPEDPARMTTAWALGLPPGSKLGVIAIDQGNVRAMKGVLQTMVDEGLQTLILVSRLPLTTYSKKFLADKAQPGEVIQHFQYGDLQKPIVDHKLVPRHAPLNQAMTKVVVDRFVGGKFPRLLVRDPMVRFLGLPMGAIVAVREVFGREQAVITYFEVHDVY